MKKSASSLYMDLFSFKIWHGNICGPMIASAVADVLSITNLRLRVLQLPSAFR